MNEEVVIGIDPHKGSNTAAVIDPVSRAAIDIKRFANTADGYEQLRRFADRWTTRRWAVEGCHGAGRHLAQRLLANNELVLDVPAKLVARVRVFSQGHARKTDPHDAFSVGLAALHGDGVTSARRDDALVSLRLLFDRRDELRALRTQAARRLHRLLVELTPGGMNSEISVSKGAALLAKIRPIDDVAVVRLQLAHEHLDDIRTLDGKLKTLIGQIASLMRQTGTGLTDLYGVGPIIAGRIIAEVETVTRFASKDHFASYNGTA